jgi:hypothetical protein
MDKHQTMKIVGMHKGGASKGSEDGRYNIATLLTSGLIDELKR